MVAPVVRSPCTIETGVTRAKRRGACKVTDAAGRCSDAPHEEYQKTESGGVKDSW